MVAIKECGRSILTVHDCLVIMLDLDLNKSGVTGITEPSHDMPKNSQTRSSARLLRSQWADAYDVYILMRYGSPNLYSRRTSTSENWAQVVFQERRTGQGQSDVIRKTNRICTCHCSSRVLGKILVFNFVSVGLARGTVIIGRGG